MAVVSLSTTNGGVFVGSVSVLSVSSKLPFFLCALASVSAITVPRKFCPHLSGNHPKNFLLNRMLSLDDPLRLMKILPSGDGSIEPLAVFSQEMGGHNKPFPEGTLVPRATYLIKKPEEKSQNLNA